MQHSVSANASQRLHQGRLGPLDAAALLIYIALTATGAFFHEGWADEVQAWLIARDCSLWQVFFIRMHYEGAPGLWHLVLWLPAHMGLSIAAMQWIAVLFCAGSIYLLLRWSPFPTWLRLSLPFTAAFLYQAPVVARSYCLTILLAFLITTLLRNKSSHLMTLAVLCGLIANTSAFGFAFSLGFIFLIARDIMHDRGRFERKKLVRASAVLLVLWLFAIWTALPAPDEDSGMGIKLNSHPAAHRFFAAVTGIPLTPQEEVKPTGPPAVDATTKPPMSYTWQSRLWDHFHVAGHTPLSLKLTKQLLLLTSLATYILSSSAIFGVLFYIELLIWASSSKRLLWLAPFFLVLLSVYAAGADPNHVLLMWAALVCSIWLAWPTAPVKSIRAQRVFYVFLVLTIVQQIAWSVHAYAWDLHNAYDPGKDTARYLQSLPAGTRIAAFDYDTLTPNGYVKKNLYFNQTSTYWPWRASENPSHRFDEVMQQHPDIVVSAVVLRGTAEQVQSQIVPWEADAIPSTDSITRYGYVKEKEFCSKQPTRMGFHHTDCLIVFRRENP